MTNYFYGISVKASDPFFNKFYSEIKRNDEGEIFQLHEAWCGLDGYILGNKIVIGYCGVDPLEIREDFRRIGYEEGIRDFLGDDYEYEELAMFNEDGTFVHWSSDYSVQKGDDEGRLTLFEFLMECNDDMLQWVSESIEEVKKFKKETENDEI